MITLLIVDSKIPIHFTIFALTKQNNFDEWQSLTSTLQLLVDKHQQRHSHNRDIEGTPTRAENFLAEHFYEKEKLHQQSCTNFIVFDFILRRQFSIIQLQALYSF